MSDSVSTSVLTEAHWKNLASHPRLLASASRFESLKHQNDEVSVQLKALLQWKADQYLTAKEIDYPPTGFLFGPMREVQGRIITLALMYRLSGESKYLERARHELMRLSALPEWRVTHFLDVGEGALAAGLGLDWLYDELTPEERSRIQHAIITNALTPSLEVRDGNGSWMGADFNWNQVCNGGLVVGALAAFESDPALAQRVIARAIKSVPAAGAAYAPDGTYAEGAAYWSYGTTFHVILVEALRSALGTSYDLEKPPGFLASADFMMQLEGPRGENYDFSDSEAIRDLSEPVLLWFARERKNRGVAHDELKNIEALYGTYLQGRPRPTPGRATLSRHLGLELLWWNPNLPDGGAELPLHWTAGGVLPLAVMRSAWNDPNATYLAIKGGSPNHSHGHMDAGSFILEADGVRWALDLGREDYNRMRAAQIDLWNYSQDSTRWVTFRPGPDAHNLLRFNGARQDIEGKAEIRRLPSENGIEGDMVELTSLYRTQVEQVQRFVRLLPDKSVSIEDRWTTGKQPVKVSWQWLTRADIARTPQGVRLTQEGKTLDLNITADAKIAVEIEDVSQPKAPQDSPNPGLHRLVVHLETGAKSHGSLSVRAIPGSVNSRS